MCGKFQGPPANGASLDRFLMANWAIYTNLVAGKQLKVGNVENFGPIPWQAAEIIGGLLATELQSDRVTDTQGYSVYGWVKFFCA